MRHSEQAPAPELAPSAPISRRTVVIAGIGVAGVGGATLSLGLAGHDSNRRTSTPTARATVPAAPIPLRSHYAALVGKVVTLRGTQGVVRARLTDISDLPGAVAGDRETSFSLALTTLGSRRPPDEVVVVRGPKLPSHQLFVSALGPDRGLQAVIDRRRI